MSLNILSFPDRTSSRFPLCVLHGVTLVNRLPDVCAFRHSRPLEYIQHLKDSAYLELGRADGNSGTALDVLARGEVCLGCIRANGKHSRILTLRARHV